MADGHPSGITEFCKKKTARSGHGAKSNLTPSCATTTRPTARDPDAFKSVLTRMNADGWRSIRILAAKRDTTLNALAVEAFNDLLKKNGNANRSRIRFSTRRSSH
jgi:hypothetical protein